jgi:hypothetical protein
MIGNQTDGAKAHGYFLLRYDELGDTISFDGANHFHRTLNHYECLRVRNWPTHTRNIAAGSGRSSSLRSLCPVPEDDLVKRFRDEREALATESGVDAIILSDELDAPRPVLKRVPVDALSLDEWITLLNKKSKLKGWSSYAFNQSTETDMKKRDAEQAARSWHLPKVKLVPNAPFWKTGCGAYVKNVLNRIQTAFPEHCGAGPPRDAHILLQTRDGGPTAFTFHVDQQQGAMELPFTCTICTLLAKGENELLKIAFFF